MTPNLAIVEIDAPHWHMPRLWLPLFLLWIPVLFLAPLVLLVTIVVCLAARVNPWRAIAAWWAITCSLPGTRVHVSTHDSKVLVRIL